ncbi:MAG: kelch repeat-containing protein, partial [Nitrosopumilus sp.]
MKAIIILLLFFSISFSLAFAEEPSQGWERLADMPEARSEMESAVIDDKIYVIGGLSNRNSITDSVFVFDTKNETWSMGTPMPLEVHHSGAASY